MTELNTKSAWEQIFSRRPNLAKLFLKFGDKTVSEYIISHLSTPWRGHDENRKRELIATVHGIVADRLSMDVADGLAAQLADEYSISTADHHGPLSHPYFLNANLLLALGAGDKKYIPVFPVANISMNNSSFPRGLLIHDNKGEISHLPVISAASHMQPVFISKPYSSQSISRLLNLLVNTLDIAEIKIDKLSALIELLFVSSLQGTSYNEQITQVNKLIWQMLGELWDQPMAELINIEFETVVAELLLRHHLKQDTLLFQLLFDERSHELMQKHFSGIQGGFDLEKGTGTYLFWGVGEESRHRIVLRKQGGHLVSTDGSYKVELTPERIRSALRNQELMPSMLLCFITLCFYYGVECYGGFSQVDYLSDMKHAYGRILSEMNLADEWFRVEPIRTDKFNLGLGVSYLSSGVNKTFLATTLDLLIHGNETGYEQIKLTASALSLRQAMTPFLPELYSIIFHAEKGYVPLQTSSTELSFLAEKIAPAAFLE